ncbi:MAG TPA: cysteine rich repeat-containing protein [Xanthomonadales bacterium]|nr:cysteine rich repeat-containing protein [Xanthomonadales bacterium]
MKLKSLLVSSVIFMSAWSFSALAQETVVDLVQQGCSAEIEKYCSQVMIGEGRMLACFYAHEDKLSGQCQYALYQAADVLETVVTAMNYVASQCATDIETHCANVQAGEGRILECLESKGDAVSAPCKQAVADVK